VDDVEQLCERYGFRIVRELDSRGDASRRVLQVRTASGEMLVLKQTLPARAENEIACLEAWNETKFTARLIDVLTPTCYLLEFVDGPSLAEIGGTRDLAAVGSALQILHNMEVPPAMSGLFDVQEDSTQFLLFAEDTSSWDRLSAEQRRTAADAVDQLRAGMGANQLVHGDLVPSNIILSPAGPRLIDPVGRLGGGVWDLAQLAVTFFGRFGEDCLPDLLEGYGGAPPMMSEMFAWMTLRYLQKNRAEGRAEFAERLDRLSRTAFDIGAC
jgi:streptomycin 6-kinase